MLPIATISPTSTPFELNVGRPGGPNHKIIGEVLVTPVTVHVSWKSEPSVKSPHDVMLVDELLATHRRMCVQMCIGLLCDMHTWVVLSVLTCKQNVPPQYNLIVSHLILS